MRLKSKEQRLPRPNDRIRKENHTSIQYAALLLLQPDVLQREYRTRKDDPSETSCREALDPVGVNSSQNPKNPPEVKPADPIVKQQKQVKREKRIWEIIQVEKGEKERGDF